MGWTPSTGSRVRGILDWVLTASCAYACGSRGLGMQGRVGVASALNVGLVLHDCPCASLGADVRLVAVFLFYQPMQLLALYMVHLAANRLQFHRCKEHAILSGKV